MILSYTDSDDRESSQLLESASGLLLRVLGGEHDGRLVRLQSHKCTIGASPSCTLRLAGAGLKPVHCLIVRGSRGSVVRRWACDTRLNDADFRDSWLVPGDRLHVGPIQLEVLDDRFAESMRAAEPMDQLPRQSIESERDTRRVVRQLSRRRMGRICKRLRTVERRLAALQEQWSQQRERFAPYLTSDWSENSSDWSQPEVWREMLEAAWRPLQEKQREIAEQQEQLRGQESELRTQKQRLDQQFQQLLLSQEQVQRDHEQLADHRELECQVEELKSKCRALTAEQSQLARQRQELDVERAELNEQIIRLQQHVDELQAELARRNAMPPGPDWESECRALQERSETQTQEHRRLADELKARIAELEHALASANEERAAGEAAAESASSEQREALITRCQLIESECNDLLEERKTLVAELESLQQAMQKQEAAWQQRFETQRDELESDWLRQFEERCAALRVELTHVISERDAKHRSLEELQHAYQSLQQNYQHERELREDLESQILAATSLAPELPEPIEHAPTGITNAEAPVDGIRSVHSPNELVDDQTSVAPSTVAPEDRPSWGQTSALHDLTETMQLSWDRPGFAPSSPLMPTELESDPDFAASPNHPATWDGEAEFSQAGGEDVSHQDAPHHSEERRYGFASQIPTTDEVAYYQENADSPTDTAAVLAKFSYHYDREDELDSDEMASSPLEQNATAASDWASPSASDSKGQDEDLAISDYMAELMRRVGGKSPDAMPSSLPEALKTPPVKPTPPRVKQPAVSLPLPHDTGDLPAPRKSLPPIDLHAMRDVANETARVAINQHCHKRSLQDVYLRWTLSAIALMTGVGLSLWINKLVCLPSLGAVLSYGAAAIWFWQGAARRQAIIRSAAETPLPDADKPANEDSNSTVN